jgi:hypothetical protein
MRISPRGDCPCHCRIARNRPPLRQVSTTSYSAADQESAEPLRPSLALSETPAPLPTRAEDTEQHTRSRQSPITGDQLGRSRIVDEWALRRLHGSTPAPASRRAPLSEQSKQDDPTGRPEGTQREPEPMHHRLSTLSPASPKADLAEPARTDRADNLDFKPEIELDHRDTQMNVTLLFHTIFTVQPGS